MATLKECLFGAHKNWRPMATPSIT